MKQPVPSDNKCHAPDPCPGSIIVPSLRPPKPEVLNSGGNRNVNHPCLSCEKGWPSPQCLSRQLCPRKVRCNPPWIAWCKGYGGSPLPCQPNVSAGPPLPLSWTSPPRKHSPQILSPPMSTCHCRTPPWHRTMPIPPSCQTCRRCTPRNPCPCHRRVCLVGAPIKK